ncbi:MAG: hypothetical protein WCX47_00180 [Bacilli bacterium]|jgi:hypothetical protein|nr:hypothetical protein [Bacilli bacterium]MDD3388879.1 hypothetical protein [Bacilli bacterium]MDD4344667.1 hypothetical protein [Bacilli bacterium]MDD4520559.1 hypothetical protein [Bacilli bacterium]MDY0399251.1 hypothetical protein [Bacilli bacterium]
MGKCRNCGSLIDDQEKYCPVCGVINPIRVKKEQTVNDTSFLDPVEPDYALYQQRSRFLTFIFFCLLGYSGAGFFYLGYKKRAWLWLSAHLVLIGGLTTLAALTTQIPWYQALIIVFGLLWLVNIGIALYYRIARDVKDATGEFLK